MIRTLRTVFVAAVTVVLLAPEAGPPSPVRAAGRRPPPVAVPRVVSPRAGLDPSPREHPPAEAGPSPRAAQRWIARLNALTRGVGVSVSVGEAGSFLYQHKPAVRRAPASNEKLPLSM